MVAPSWAELAPKGKRGQALRLDYNPATVSMSGGATWHVPDSKGAAAPREYLECSPRSLSFAARLDARATTTSTVSQRVEIIFGWLKPTTESIAKNAPAATVLTLNWGRQRWFDVVLTQVSAEFSLFDPNGTPIRAELSLTFEQVDTPTPRQNPTSGGVPGRRVRQLVAGDSLMSVASQEYGDPRYWRDLAVLNRIDDPSALRPGTGLLLPAHEDLEPHR